MQLRERTFPDPSKFLWTDLHDAHRQLERRVLQSPVEQLALFIDSGYSISPSAAPINLIDQFMAELNAKIDGPDGQLFMTYWDGEGKKHERVRRKNLECLEAKVLDVHRYVESAQALIFCPKILSYLRDIFGEDPVAFQTLYFEYGSCQGAHNDTAFVLVDPPEKFVASWIALEDVEPLTGELFYYAKSHKIGDQIFANGGKAFDSQDEHAGCYTPELERILAEHQLSKSYFLPRRGDVLFWAANLVHGGQKIERRQTRRSLVTHYCPLSATVPYARFLDKMPEPVEGGGWIVSAT